MKLFLANLGINLVSIVCAIAAAYIAAHGGEGWGWFLLVALLCAGSAKSL